MYIIYKTQLSDLPWMNLNMLPLRAICSFDKEPQNVLKTPAHNATKTAMLKEHTEVINYFRANQKSIRLIKEEANITSRAGNRKLGSDSIQV